MRISEYANSNSRKRNGVVLLILSKGQAGKSYGSSKRAVHVRISGDRYTVRTAAHSDICARPSTLPTPKNSHVNVSHNLALFQRSKNMK